MFEKNTLTIEQQERDSASFAFAIGDFLNVLVDMGYITHETIRQLSQEQIEEFIHRFNSEIRLYYLEYNKQLLTNRKKELEEKEKQALIRKYVEESTLKKLSR